MQNPYRIGPVQLPAEPLAEREPITVQLGDDGEGAPSKPIYDPKTGATSVEVADGVKIISFTGAPKKPKDDGDKKFYDNLVDSIDPQELSSIADDLMTGIESDIASVQEYHEDLAEGIKMLGFRLEEPGDGDTAGTDLGLSRVYHPILQESVLRFQANARGELLPAEGPVKVEATGDGPDDDDLAEALEGAMNRFFTKTASEYYPDTIRLLFDTGFGGSGFKKCYHSPTLGRPVSESIPAKHFVVSNAARDLRSCGRKTHIVEMTHTDFKRMQILGVYIDTAMSEPTSVSTNPVDMAQNEAMGIKPQTARPKDMPRTLYECYANLDIAGFEDKDKDGPTGLRVPYRVTLDKDSRQILEIRRNWDEKDPSKTEKRIFVKYPFVNAMGFYGIGLFHILGNTTRALTAAWRMMLDNGMFANLPGGMIDKDANRQLTSIFRINPGDWVPIQVPIGKKASDIAAPLPYRDVSAAFMQLTEMISTTGQRVGGTAELSIGEGKQDAPVGTTLALLEQATKTMDAVHKGLHAAQAEEFGIMKELFLEDPESLMRDDDGTTDSWDKEQIIVALQRCDIIPRADPNTPSHMHRIMKAQGLVQLATAAPDVIDKREAIEEALDTLGYGSKKNKLMIPPGSGGQPAPDPKVIAEQIRAQAATQKAQLDLEGKKMDAQSEAANDQRAAALETLKSNSEARRIELQSQADEREAHLNSIQHAQGLETMALGHKVAQAAHKRKLAEVKKKRPKKD